MSERPDAPTNYKALGMTFMLLGVSIGITFGLTLGWVFAPIGLTFFALGFAFLAKAEEGE